MGLDMAPFFCHNLTLDMFIDLEAHLNALADRSPPEGVNGRIAQYEHPDLKAFKDPEGVVRFCSFSVLPFVTDVEIKHDKFGMTYVMLYTSDKGVRIYSDPPLMYVGRYNENGFGEIQDEGWKEQAVEEEWPNDIVKRVQNYFEQHPTVYW